MGSRATYYLVKNGEVTISSSKWGAYGVDRQLLYGFGGVSDYFNPPDGSYAYTDEIWCEGGFVIDMDRQILRMFGGETAGVHVSLRPAYLALLRIMWPNWDVDWAYDGIDELGDVAFQTTRDPIDERHFQTKKEVWQRVRPIAERTPLYSPVLADGEDVVILSFFYGPGECIDYVVPSDNAFEILALGPQLKDHLNANFQCELPTEEDNLVLRGGAIIEPGRKHVDVWFDQSSPIGMRLLTECWEGWTVERHNKGLAWHAERTGLDPEEYRLPLEVAISRLLTALDEYRGFRNDPLVRKILVGVDEADEARCLAKHLEGLIQ